MMKNMRSKKLVFALAFALVLVSGGFTSAQACGFNLSGWHLSPCSWHIAGLLPHCLFGCHTNTAVNGQAANQPVANHAGQTQAKTMSSSTN